MQRGLSTTNLDTLTKPQKGKILTEEEKTKEHTLKLLEWRTNREQLKIDKMLDRYMISQDYHAINSKRHIDDIVEQLFSIINIFVCYSNDQRKLRKKQSDPHIINRITEFYKVMFRDEHGQPVI